MNLPPKPGHKIVYLQPEGYGKDENQRQKEMGKLIGFNQAVAISDKREEAVVEKLEEILESDLPKGKIVRLISDLKGE